MSEAPQDVQTGTGSGHRQVQLRRVGHSRYEVTNARGGTMVIASGDGPEFTPVELLLTAIAGCSAVDVDFITSRRAEPVSFEVTSEGEKIKDDGGNRMGPITITFSVTFPDGDAADSARSMLPRAIAQSHDRLCTVSRSVELGTPIATCVADGQE